MPKPAKKHKFPTKPCPKCGKPIHARLQKHEACGWVMESNGKAGTATAIVKKHKRSKGKRAAASTGSITVQDIEAVKKLVDAMGAEKVKQLAQVLAR